MGMWGSVCGFLRLFCAFPLDRIQLSDFVISREQYGRNPEDTIPRRKRVEWVSDDIYCFNSVFSQINSILIVWNPYRSVGIFIYLITQLNWSAFTKIYSRKHICEIYRWNENKLGGKTTKTETICRQDRRQLELYSKMNVTFPKSKPNEMRQVWRRVFGVCHTKQFQLGSVQKSKMRR